MYLQGLVFLLCALYGSVFIFGKLTLEYAPPFFVTGTRMILAGTLLLIYQALFNRKALVLKKEHLLPLFVIGLTGVYLTNVLEFWGLQYLEAGRACFLYSFSPIATAVLSYIWLSEKITFQKLIGLFIGIAGFMPLFIGPDSIEDNSGKFWIFTYAELTILGAAIATSIGWLTMRLTVQKKRYSPVMANAVSMLIGGVFSLIHSFHSETWDPFPVTDWGPFLQWFLALTLVSNLICYNLHSVLLKSFTATYISFAGLTQPFFAAFFGWLFLDEVLTAYFWISIFAVTMGLYIYYQDELRASITKRAKK